MSETKATLEDQVRAIAAVAFPNDREARRQYANQILALLQSNGDERERLGRVDGYKYSLVDAKDRYENRFNVGKSLTAEWILADLGVHIGLCELGSYPATLTKAREAGKCDECPRPIERPLVGKCSHHADLMPAGQEGEVKL